MIIIINIIIITLHCIIQQYSTVQYSTVQYSTVQYSTVRFLKGLNKSKSESYTPSTIVSKGKNQQNICNTNNVHH